MEIPPEQASKAVDKPSPLRSTATATTASASSSGAEGISRGTSGNDVCCQGGHAELDAWGLVGAGQTQQVTVDDDTKPLLCEICAGGHDSSGDDVQPHKYKRRFWCRVTLAIVCSVAVLVFGVVSAGITKPGQAFLQRADGNVDKLLPKPGLQRLPQLNESKVMAVVPPTPRVGICSVFGCGQQNPLRAVCSCHPSCEEQGTCCSDYAAVCSLKADLSDSDVSTDGSTRSAIGNAEEDHVAVAPCSPKANLSDSEVSVAGSSRASNGNAEKDHITVATAATSSSPALQTNLTEELLGRLRTAKGPIDMKFYMYRAQSDADYLPENINAADLPGVLWYLHNEIVVSTPRKYGVTRILRFEVTMQNTQDLYGQTRSQFGPFVAFDMGRCTVPNCQQLWDKYGYVVGCQTLGSSYASATTGKGGSWYSLPGPCPDMSFNAPKTEQCVVANPGGSCDQVTGARSCTFHAEHAGEIRLDELVGIPDYGVFSSSGKQEYSVVQDQGVGLSFWDGKNDPAACSRRVQRAQELFHQHYPEHPAGLAEPPCR